MSSPISRLVGFGQSPWNDNLTRALARGGLRLLVEEHGIRGVTSNPTIFEKAMAAGTDYDEQLASLVESGVDTEAAYWDLVLQDIGDAADLLRPYFDGEWQRADGFVSIEVGPHLANDTEGSIREARRLWQECDRRNVMVKIPGTAAGVPAIRRCIAEGININITLLFSVARYREVMEAYLSALEERVAAGQPIDRLRSVASFFVSRVDTNVDKKLDRLGTDAARRLRGKAAIANARLAYQAFREVFGAPRFAALREKGALLQRPLWASTSTKDPAYPDLYYVEALVAPDTVDTMPPETFASYRDHGDPKVRISDDLDEAADVFRRLAELGIEEPVVSRELEEEGVRKFSDSYDSLLKTLAEKEKAMRVA